VASCRPGRAARGLASQPRAVLRCHQRRAAGRVASDPFIREEDEDLASRQARGTRHMPPHCLLPTASPSFYCVNSNLTPAPDECTYPGLGKRLETLGSRDPVVVGVLVEGNHELSSNPNVQISSLPSGLETQTSDKEPCPGTRIPSPPLRVRQSAR
jgi:hypothetical protein